MARAFTHEGKTGLKLLVEQKPNDGWDVSRDGVLLLAAKGLRSANVYAEAFIQGYEDGLEAAKVWTPQTDGFGKEKQ